MQHSFLSCHYLCLGSNGVKQLAKMTNLPSTQQAFNFLTFTPMLLKSVVVWFFFSVSSGVTLFELLLIPKFNNYFYKHSEWLRGSIIVTKYSTFFWNPKRTYSPFLSNTSECPLSRYRTSCCSLGVQIRTKPTQIAVQANSVMQTTTVRLAWNGSS
jgi:hypothetical protein